MDVVRATQNPSAQQWTEIKPVFLRLYVEENRKLEEVREILTRDYNFTATVKAFKFRITEWKAFKNYKHSEKDHLARQRDLLMESGTERSDITIRGRQVKRDRVHRHTKAEASKRTKVDHTSMGVPTANEHGLIKGVQPLLAHTLIGADELMLSASRNFFQWHTFHEIRLWGFKVQPLRAQICHDYGVALCMLQIRSRWQDGWQLITTLCDSLRGTIADDPFSAWFLIQLFVIMPEQDMYLQLVNHLVPYIRRLAVILRPEHCPFRVLMLRFEGQQALKRHVSRMSSIFISVLMENNHLFHNYPGGFSGISLIQKSLQIDHISDTHRRFSRLLEPGRSMDYFQLVLLHILAHLTIGDGKYNTDTVQALEASTLCEAGTSLDNPDDVHYRLANLWTVSAICYEKRKLMDRAVNAYRSALDLTLDQFGPRHPYTTTCFQKITNLIRKSHQWTESEAVKDAAWYLSCELCGTSINDIDTENIDGQVQEDDQIVLDETAMHLWQQTAAFP